MNKIIISLTMLVMVLGVGVNAQVPNNIKTTDIKAGSVNAEAQQLKAQQNEAIKAARVAREEAEALAKEQREALKTKAESAKVQLQNEREALKLKTAESQERLKIEKDVLSGSVEAEKASREALKQKVEQEKEAIKASREEFKQKAEQVREEMKTSREEFKNKIDVKKEELKTKREEQKSELKTKLETIKDERKKATVEKLDKRFDEINVKTTTQWTNALVRLEDLLVKVSLRADKAAANGADVSAVGSALERAKLAIEAARSAITTQVGRAYPISIVSESELRSAVAQTRDLLSQDLKAVREVIKSAQQATVDAVTALKAVPKVDEAQSPATSTSAMPIQ